jgi:hypothetical protein
VDVESQLKQKWLEATEYALNENALRFLCFLVERLLESDCLVSYFESKAYEARCA